LSDKYQEIEMADNFRHAQYREDGTQIDDPQKLKELSQSEILGVQALVLGAGILQRGSLPYTTPTFGGTGGAMTFGGKKRRMDWAGTPGQYVYRSGTMHMSDLQFGTRTTDTPASLSTSAYATDIETGGAQPALYSPVTTAGTMSIAAGRFRQRADGSVRIMHYADDALYSSSPRFQITSFLMPNRVKLRTNLVVQFGDAETPWPAYVVGKQNCLFWQIKGATGQPPMALNIERQSDGTLKLYFNRKKSNATGIFTAGTVSGLSTNTQIAIEIQYTLDWLTMDEGGSAQVALLVNGSAVELFDSAGDSEGYASVQMPTVFTDVDQAYTMINGIYRYDYAATKAPDDAAMIFWQHETRVRQA
jgi:hypothetical protein